MIKTSDCNNCGRTQCDGRKGNNCEDYLRPKPVFQLAELALFHPQGLVSTEQLLRNSRPRLTLRLSDYLR